MKHRSLPVMVVVLLVVVALAGMGVAYTWWADSLYMNGTVDTAKFEVQWYDIFTNDDGAVAHPGYDDGDTGSDPVAVGTNPSRTDAVASCAAIMYPETDPDTMSFHLDNAYPGYYCSVWANVQNTGEVPIRIKSVTVSGFGSQVDYGFYGSYVGQVVNNGGGLLPVGVWVHPNENASPDSTYTGTVTFNVEQWNAP